MLDLIYFSPLLKLSAAFLFIYVQRTSDLTFDFDLLATAAHSSAFQALFRPL